jgi:acetyl esterase/lipase
LENEGIIVSADYRLLPTANGIADVAEDLEDFWKWSRSELPAVLDRHAPGQSLDYSRLLLVGGSAGGYCTFQLALSHPEDISAVATAYPFVDPQDDIFTKGPAPGEPIPLRFPAEDLPSKEETIAWIEEARKTITTKAGFERTLFCVAATQYGLFASKVIGDEVSQNPYLTPQNWIKTGAKLPKNV